MKIKVYTCIRCSKFERLKYINLHIFSKLEFITPIIEVITTPYVNFHLLATNADAKYYFSLIYASFQT